ncbi:MAG TPA: YggT family protein [Candidatus Dormibacteraeota bacterium]|nr:YggT family protein [Candidatus Dormibacteraeota bacterium]
MEQKEQIVREEPAPAVDAEVVSRFSPARRAYETIYVVFAIIVGAIVVRVLLKLLAANTAVAFTQFMYGVTDPMLAPFRNILPTYVSGRTVFESSALIAILIYGLVGIALAKLVAIMFMRDVTVAQGSRSGRIRPNTN